MSNRNKKPNGFCHSPFKDLKGLSVSGTSRKPPSTAAPGSPGPDTPEVHLNEDPLHFEREMQGLGVKRLTSEEGSAVVAGGALRGDSPAPSGKSRAEVDDAALFREAVNGMDQIFKEELPDAEATGIATPRRSRQLKMGNLKPEAQLDLHGMKSEDALQKVQFFLENSRHHGFRTVLIITGKGNRSDTGPVLRNAVAGLLEQMQGQVVEWTTAPRQYGGNGAMVVFLR